MREGWRVRAKSLALAAATALAGAAVVAGPAAPDASAATAVAVTVNGTAGLGAIPGGAIGLNTAVYDGYMNDAAIPGLLKTAGVTALRYPGGSYADIYNWQTNVAQGGYDAPNTSFANFMATAQAAGSNPVIATNYGTGTPSLAASWVTQADVTNNYGITYWEVGNEVYGNGTYGANWEADAHCTDSSGKPVTIGSEPQQTYGCGPTTYANNLLGYISAMQAAKSGIHVCAVLTTPGFWPDGVTNAQTSPQPWNQTVLSILKARTDCVIVHYYPGGSTTAGMLTDPTDIGGIVSTLRSQISQYAGVNASGVKIIVTETNSTIDLDTHPAALFAADMYLTWLENGVTNVDWWNEHNGASAASTVDGAQDYGDQGIFSNGSSIGGATEPAVDTPFAPYYGIEMLTKVGTAGDQLVATSSGNPLLRTHAVRRADGTLDVLIDNEDPSTSYTVNLSYNGFTPSGTVHTWTLANNATTITSGTQASAGSVTVGPYSLTVLQVPGTGGTGSGDTTPPTAPTNLAVTGTTAASVSLSWSASTDNVGVVAYDVYRNGTKVGTASGTTYTDTGLTAGTAYTYTVRARDGAGNVSAASSGVTATTPGGGTSSGCAASYAVNNDWGSGFTATVTVANTGTAATTGWHVTWAWAGNQQVTGSWNATVTQSGVSVSAANAGYNGAVAPGSTTSFGFQASYSGGNATPTLVCTAT